MIQCQVCYRIIKDEEVHSVIYGLIKKPRTQKIWFRLCSGCTELFLEPIGKTENDNTINNSPC